MKKIFHLHKKINKSNNYYGSLSAVFKENKDLGVSKSKLDKWDFNEPFENGLCTIIKSEMKTTGDVSGSVRELISDNSGITLLNHSKLVSIFAVEIAKQTISYQEDSLIENIKTSALLHNIGKCCKIFQKDIKHVPKKERKVEFLYNEIGWAFLSKYIHTNTEYILDGVYWSNGIRTNKNKRMGEYNNNNILDSIDEYDKNLMLEFLKEILPPSSYYYNDIKKDAPVYYSKENIKNAEKTFIRTCIISAYKLVSSLDPNQFKELFYTQDANEIKKIIENLPKKKFYKEHVNFDSYDSKRLQIQKNISELCEKTTIVNATAGFGKSLIGILWNIIYSNKKLIWVCPTNVISEASYLNILKELKALGISDKITVELYFTGKTQKSNNLSEKFIEFNSDIIVTNIDNFLSPSISNSNSERLFFINNCDVVFDEYHKLLCDEALFAGFINIITTRHRFTNSRTLLLSATPVKINHLWDGGINPKTKILPDDNSHYPAAHKKKYKLNTFDLPDINDFNLKGKKSSVIIFNVIGNSQIIHKKIKSTRLAHSHFCLDDREKIFSSIYDDFGKNSSRSLTKNNITGTHVIQESLDISFADIHESVISPLTSLQRIGRCDRWGDYNKIPEVNIYRINDRSENKMKDILYTRDLSDKWFSYISNNGKTFDLDKLYILYNEFNKINSVEIDKYIDNCYDKSLISLSKLYPHHSKKQTNRSINARSNKLRSSGLEIFFICKVHNSDKYSAVISDSNYSNFKNYGEDEATLGCIIKAMKEIRKMKDDRYDYDALIKQWDINNIRYSAKDSDTPYIRFDVVYHPELGVIKKSILSQIK